MKESIELIVVLLFMEGYSVLFLPPLFFQIALPDSEWLQIPVSPLHDVIVDRVFCKVGTDRCLGLG